MEEGEINEEYISHFQNIAKKDGKTGPDINKLIATELTNLYGTVDNLDILECFYPCRIEFLLNRKRRLEKN